MTPNSFDTSLLSDIQAIDTRKLMLQEPPTDLMRPVQLGGRLYVCGDHRDHATLDGALKSGRRAAEALISDNVQETTGADAPSEPVAVDQTELA